MSNRTREKAANNLTSGISDSYQLNGEWVWSCYRHA
jgi:hypothetical protein